MVRLVSCALLLGLLGGTLAACGDDDSGGGDSGGSDRRTVQIIRTDDGCTPATIDAKVGEKLRFEVRNDGKKDSEVEGIEGAKLEEVLIPSGKTRNVNYTAPSKAGTQKIKCYVPSGTSTIIEVKVS